MTSVLRLDERLAAMAWPALEEWQDVHFARAATVVLCAGFEERALAFLRRACERPASDMRVVLVEYASGSAANQLGEALELCARAAVPVTRVDFDRENPQGCGERVATAAASGESLCVDVAGMSRLLIVQVIAAMIRAGRLADLEIVYAEAADYPPSRNDVAEHLTPAREMLDLVRFLSDGVFGVTVVPELSSVAMQGQPLRVIAFPSWNPAQLAAVRTEIQPSYYTVVHGVPPNTEDDWRTRAIREINCIDGLRDFREEYVSTLDYRETVTLVLREYREHAGREKLVVSPTGSKMQTVAIGLLCGFLNDLQIVYPTPRFHADPHNYTRGVGRLFRLRLADVAARLQERGGTSSETRSSIA